MGPPLSAATLPAAVRRDAVPGVCAGGSWSPESPVVDGRAVGEAELRGDSKTHGDNYGGPPGCPRGVALRARASLPGIDVTERPSRAMPLIRRCPAMSAEARAATEAEEVCRALTVVVNDPHGDRVSGEEDREAVRPPRPALRRPVPAADAGPARCRRAPPGYCRREGGRSAASRAEAGCRGAAAQCSSRRPVRSVVCPPGTGDPPRRQSARTTLRRREDAA